MTVRNILAEQHDDVVAPYFAALEMNLAGRTECDPEVHRIGPRHVNRPSNLTGCRRRVRAGLAHLRHRDAPDEPRIALKLAVSLLVLCGPLTTPAIRAAGESARMQAAVDRRDHENRDVGFHQ